MLHLAAMHTTLDPVILLRGPSMMSHGGDADHMVHQINGCNVSMDVSGA